MSMGLIGKKCGMSRLFTPQGASVAVTVIKVEPNTVTQLKTREKEGYVAIQVTTGSARANRLSMPEKGHFAKAGVEPGRGLWEFPVEEAGVAETKPGTQFTLTQFQVGQIVKVTGTTQGKGYAGVIKRHNFHMQDATHGNSLAHRAAGSIGQCQDPGRVFKGKKMAGHMGNVQRTTRGLEIIQIDSENNLLLVKGSVPGSKGGNVRIVPMTFPQATAKAQDKGDK